MIIFTGSLGAGTLREAVPGHLFQDHRRASPPLRPHLRKTRATGGKERKAMPGDGQWDCEGLYLSTQAQRPAALVSVCGRGGEGVEGRQGGGLQAPMLT